VLIAVIWHGEYAETHSSAFMPLLTGAVVLASFVMALFLCRNGETAIRRQHARFTPEDVQSAVENSGIGQGLGLQLSMPPTPICFRSRLRYVSARAGSWKL
jgi:hypothetical protein